MIPFAQNLKLYSKGILLVAIPFACQIVLVAALVCLLINEQNAAALNDRSKDVINRTHTIGFRVCDVFISGSLPEYGTEAQLSAIRFNQMNLLEKQFKKLLQQLQEEPEQRENAQELEQIANRLMYMLKHLARIDTLTLPPHTQNEISVAFFELMDRYLPLQTRIINVETERSKSAPAEAASRRNLLHLMLAASLLSTLAVSAFMAYYYINSIRKPLQSLSENAKRISRRERLLPTMMGGDEFATLDVLFHAVDKALKEANENEVALLNNAADMICTLDSEGNFHGINPFGLRLLTGSTNPIENKSIYDFCRNDDRATLEAELKSATSETKNHSFEATVQTSQGDSVETLWSCFWSEIDRRLFCVVRDITEQKTIERFKQDLFAMISHDLRTPLTSVSGRMEMLQMMQQKDLSDHANKAVERIRIDVKELLSLVDDLLDFQRLRAKTIPLDMVETDLIDPLLAAVSTVKPLAESKSCSIVSDLGDEIWCICDRKTTRQTIEILCNIAVENSPPNATVSIRLTQDDVHAHISIEDEGSSKYASMGAELFSIFERLSVEESDLKSKDALALSIAKLIMDRHDGHIGVQRNEKGGATWLLEFLLAGKEREEADTESA